MTIENLVPWRRSTSLAQAPLSATAFPSISSLQREMNRMFNTIWSASPSLAPQSSLLAEDGSIAFYPEVEMSETDGHIDISAELPGVDEKDIDVMLSQDGNLLTIKGEKKFSKEKQDKDYYCAERSYGVFRRTMSLPTTVNADKVNAKFKNGVLEISLTKVADAAKGVKHIEIK